MTDGELTISRAAQDYLKSIYKAQYDPEGGGTVNTTDLSQRMRVAAASVTHMVKRLAEMKLVTHTPYRGVALTESGEKVALEVIRHHRLLERYLMDTLGYSWDEVDEEADRLEHVISEEFEARIDKALGYPTTDPHGDPIPTKDGAIASSASARLSDVDEGLTVEIRQVSDRDPEMLRYMDDLGLRPAARLTVEEKAPFNGPIRIRLAEGSESDTAHAIGREVAEHIYVANVT